MIHGEELDSSPSKGRATRRLYSEFDVLVLMVINYLKKSGLHNDSITKLVNGMRYNENTIMLGNENQLLLFGVEGGIKLYTDKYDMVEELINGKALWVISVGQVKVEVFKELRSWDAAIKVENDMKVRVG